MLKSGSQYRDRGPTRGLKINKKGCEVINEVANKYI